jgi:predicted enzyme related to lactoylglutathione lyase
MNRVVHFEIMADDLDRAQKFYESAFGWTFQAMGEAYGGYRVIVTGPGPDDMAKGVRMEDVGINGGLMKRNAPLPADGQSPNAYTAIIGVANIDEAMAKIDAAGGAPQTEKMDVAGVGKVRYYKDTEGNIFGIIEPAPMA